MRYLNDFKQARNNVVLNVNQAMTISFEIKNIDSKYQVKLQGLLDQKNNYEGYFKLHSFDGEIKWISYETDCSDDWSCAGVDALVGIVDECLSELFEGVDHE